jgi:hypothetical protein
LFINRGSEKITHSFKYFLICVSICLKNISTVFFGLRLFLTVPWTPVYVLNLIFHDTFVCFKKREFNLNYLSFGFGSHPPDAIKNIELHGCLGCYLSDILIDCWVHPLIEIVYNVVQVNCTWNYNLHGESKILV